MRSGSKWLRRKIKGSRIREDAQGRSGMKAKIYRFRVTKFPVNSPSGHIFFYLKFLFQCEKIIEKFNGQPLTDPKDVTKSTVSARLGSLPPSRMCE